MAAIPILIMQSYLNSFTFSIPLSLLVMQQIYIDWISLALLCFLCGYLLSVCLYICLCRSLSHLLSQTWCLIFLYFLSWMGLRRKEVSRAFCNKAFLLNFSPDRTDINYSGDLNNRHPNYRKIWLPVFYQMGIIG